MHCAVEIGSNGRYLVTPIHSLYCGEGTYSGTWWIEGSEIVITTGSRDIEADHEVRVDVRYMRPNTYCVVAVSTDRQPWPPGLPRTHCSIVAQRVTTP